MENLNYKEILIRKPFYEVQPMGYMRHGGVFKDINGNNIMPEDWLYKKVKTQADFLREYYPSSHIIYDPEVFPDVIKTDPETGKSYMQPVTRTAFAFQQLIAIKHTLHVTGNDIQFEVADSEADTSNEDENQRLLSIFRKGWLLASMEVRFFEAVHSRNVVAEAAVVGYFNKGKFGAKTLSYKDGDVLYPHFDSVTGDLTLFARKYFDYDEDGVQRTEWVEVWDEKYLRRYKRSVDKSSTVTLVKDFFGINHYALVSEAPHGFPFIPVAYTRNDEGPCWANVQRNIEDYEEAFSYLSESNKAYAFPIFYIKGDGEDIDIKGDLTGAVKAISMADKDDDAGFLNGTDASDAFATQLSKAYDLIYELSFTVKPPELKSGDLPGVAVKLLYSPAIEVAMHDAQCLQPFLDKLVDMVKYGVGFENNNVTSLLSLPINAWIEPYIHQNDTELVTNLATAVQNGFLSKRTASERNSKFSKNDEYERIVREKKEEDQQDLLMQIAQQDAQLENNIEEQEAQARISAGQAGQDINTGRGSKGKAGRPNLSGKTWDENNNYLGESNWDDFNNKNRFK